MSHSPMAHLAHNPKRRRLDQAASTLSKPFKSPLRTPLKKHDEKQGNPLSDTPQNKDDATDSSRPQPDEEKKPAVDDADPTLTSTPLKKPSSTSTSTTPVYKTPLPPTLRKRKSLVSPLSSSPSITTTSDPVLSSLQKQHTALQSRLSALRSELDTAQQALRIESSAKDEELEALIRKWRSVSQDAAEEVFAGARERVLRMGGVGAWRERMRRGRERWDDAADGGVGVGEDCGGGSDVDDEEELERRRAEVVDRVEFGEEEKGQKKKEDDDDGGADDEVGTFLIPISLHFDFEDANNGVASKSFTMDMMLKFLNIDLDLIGFDKVNQRWIKD
ncbi:hypothetical protein VTN00DRAFT_9215 [Thermoascus crustaceus]|uniref:uncharacterized protein n=1 Tax=Thermoascus crustaceus TaxID=5088 RepID=UPI003742BF4C